VKDVLETGLYHSTDIYNIDVCGLELSTSGRTRRVAIHTKPPSRPRPLLPMTHSGAISTTDAPIPPFVIYPEGSLLGEWLDPRDPESAMMATVLESGWINHFLGLTMAGGLL